MTRYAYISDGTALAAPAIGFPCFIDKKRMRRIITADIWAFLAHETRARLSGDAENRAVAFLEQAEDFYRTAASSSDSSRPLLYYYAYLNLAKVFMVHQGVELPARMGHGISDPKVNIKQRFYFKTQQVKIHKSTGRGAPPYENLMLPTLLWCLDPASVRFFDRELKVLDVMGQLPAIHRTYSMVSGTGDRLVPIDSFTVVRKDFEVWARVAIKKSAATDSQIRSLCALPVFAGKLTRVCSRVASENAEFWYFEGRRVHYGPTTLETSIGAVASDLRAAGVSTVVTNDGYRYYFSTAKREDTLPQIGASVAVMFYFGSLTRYKPYDFDKIEEKYAWLMSEFLSTDPTQVLYMLASKLAKTEVVAPFALGLQ